MTRTVTVDEYRELVASEMPERGRDGLQERVRKLALDCGWRWYHVFDSRRSPEGYPDCHMLRGSRQVVAELKRENEDPTEAQIEWLEAFAEAGAETYLWKPSDLLAFRIHDVLE